MTCVKVNSPAAFQFGSEAEDTEMVEDVPFSPIPHCTKPKKGGVPGWLVDVSDQISVSFPKYFAREGAERERFLPGEGTREAFTSTANKC